MKKEISKLALLASILLMAACSSTPTANGSAKTVYINENVGFAVKGYSYKQDGLVCDIDNYLVGVMVDKAASKNINLIRVKTASQDGPLLALDIESLELGQNKRSYIGNNAVDPEIGVAVGLLIGGLTPGLTTISYHCVAFSDQIALNDSVGGSSNCSNLNKCARRVSADIVDWLAPQL